MNLKEFEKLKDGATLVVRGIEGYPRLNLIARDNPSVYCGDVAPRQISANEVIRQVWLDYEGKEITAGDICIYIKHSYNKPSTIHICRVVELKGLRVTVELEKGEQAKYASNNLLVVTDWKLKEKHPFLETPCVFKSSVKIIPYGN